MCQKQSYKPHFKKDFKRIILFRIYERFKLCIIFCIFRVLIVFYIFLTIHFFHSKFKSLLSKFYKWFRQSSEYKFKCHVMKNQKAQKKLCNFCIERVYNVVNFSKDVFLLSQSKTLRSSKHLLLLSSQFQVPCFFRCCFLRFWFQGFRFLGSQSQGSRISF